VLFIADIFRVIFLSNKLIVFNTAKIDIIFIKSKDICAVFLRENSRYHKAGMFNIFAPLLSFAFAWHQTFNPFIFAK